MFSLPVHLADRYVQPLREGGSLPAIVDTADGLYVVKFRGAGQGRRVLVAEILVAQIAHALGLPVPELALVQVEPAFGRSEPDPEIQDLLRASHGLNVGIRYLEGAFNFDPLAAGGFLTPAVAADVVWLDTYVMNPDRTARNPNLMIHDRSPWLIDHGAALYHHHDWERVSADRTVAAFPLVRQHVLLGVADDLRGADHRASERLSPEVLASMVATVPDDLLADGERALYRAWLERRFTERADWVDAAIEMQALERNRALTPRSSRR